MEADISSLQRQINIVMEYAKTLEKRIKELESAPKENKEKIDNGAD